MQVALFVWLPVLLASPLVSQDSLQARFDAAARVSYPEYDSSKRGDPDYESAYAAARKAALDQRDRRVERFLRKEELGLRTGDGLRLRARALMILQRKHEAVQPLRAFLEQSENSEHATDARIDLVRCLVFGTHEYDAAIELADRVLKSAPDAPRIGELKAAIRYARADYDSWKKREALVGRPLPDLARDSTIGPDPGPQSGWRGRTGEWCGKSLARRNPRC